MSSRMIRAPFVKGLPKMNPLFTTLSIARYESIVLLRSWFFRIFSLLAAIGIGIFDYIIFVQPRAPWMLNAQASYIPYLNLLLLNLVQAVIAVFLASEFLKDDRKLDITEVVYPHSMTNVEYVIGKILGVGGVFVVLNILLLGIGLIFNTFFSELPISAAAYLWYPLLISLPTLVFVFGLSFFLMVLIRNQAITIVLLLGYIVATLVYLSDKYHHLFDYMAFQVPLTYSDFVGFGDLTPLLVQRGIYFLLGAGFTFLTVLRLRRLPQSRVMPGLSLFLAVVCIGGGLLLGWKYVNEISQEKVLRQDMAALNSELSQSPMISLKRCGLEVVHEGSTISTVAHLLVENNTSQPLDRYVLSLNPGLKVTALTRGDKEVPFRREHHILTVTPPAELAPGAVDSITVTYRGAIDERVCFPDIDEITLAKPYRIMLYNIDKRFAFITPDYVLLTPESLWYPRAGLTEGAAWPEVLPKDYPEFSLKVKTSPDLMAISQGAVTGNGDGEFVFAPEVPLSQLSLAIGRYELKSVTVEDTLESGDSTVTELTDYNVYCLQGHDYFSQHFTALDSALPGIIRDARIQYENRLELTYPYRRFSIVETPIQFFPFQRNWMLGMETVQPEIVLMPEKAVTVRRAGFGRFMYFATRVVNSIPEERIQRNMFQQFINGTLLSSPALARGSMLSSLFSGGGIFTSTDLFDYTIFSMFHSHQRHFSSTSWPMFNLALEFYQSSKLATEQDVVNKLRARGFQGMGSDDKANLVLADRSLDEILANPAEVEDVSGILEIKCRYLFNYIEGIIGDEQLASLLKKMHEKQIFSDMNVDFFTDSLSQRFGRDLRQFYDSWMHQKTLPAFDLSNPRMYEFVEGGKTLYQILLSVTNEGDADGLLGVNFVWGKGARLEKAFGSRPQNPADERFYMVKAGQTKEIGIVMDAQIHKLWVNTCLSQNLPASRAMAFAQVRTPSGAEPFEGERVLEQSVLQDEPGVVIVDNEDPAFEVHSVQKESFLRKILNRFRKEQIEQKYIGMLGVPTEWSNALFQEFYGRYKHSGHYIKAGSGENKVAWKADLPESGKYELEYHVAEIPSMNMFRMSNSSRIKDFHFTVYDDDGANELTVDLEGTEPGWYTLGTFYFSKGEAKVELNDESKGELVYADALRWTLRE
ncbi:hypothetical protein ACFL5K_01380 [Gemmatimonadota bacterium]